MNRRIRSWALGAAVLSTGAALVTPLTALAEPDDPDEPTTTTEPDRPPRASAWLREVLGPLVESGTLTQAQLDAVLDAIERATPARPARPSLPGPRRGGWRVPTGRTLTTAAEAIGIAPRELREALADGRTIAEVAEANGVDPAVVVDALVDEATERLDDAVADGRVDEDDAERWRAGIEDDVRELVEEGGRPARPERHELPRRGPWHHRGDGADRGDRDGDEPDADRGATSTPDTVTD